MPGRHTEGRQRARVRVAELHTSVQGHDKATVVRDNDTTGHIRQIHRPHRPTVGRAGEKFAAENVDPPQRLPASIPTRPLP
jgi:hypothetical protein